MSKKKGKLKNHYEENEGIAAVRNQLNESYQTGVVEDQLKNNKGIHHFNNQKN